MTIGLRVRNLYFLRNGPYSLSVLPGECVGLTGVSGVGKTQFLRALVDVIPYEGDLFLNNLKCSAMSPCEWRKRISLLPAESRWWYDRVGDHFPKGYIAGTQALWLRKLGFSHDVMNWMVNRLSTGEKQRLSFLRALVNNPFMLLLDEPTSALDQHHTSQLEKILMDLRKNKQKALIWVSHDLDQLQRVCDRIYRFEMNGLEDFSYPNI